MTYTKQTWANGALGGTPISAARLAHMEDGIEGSARIPTNAYELYVDNVNGLDANHGKSPGTAKLTLAAAVTAAPSGGANIFLRTNQTGYYDLAAPITFTKPIWIEGMGYGQPSIRRQFDGDMFTYSGVTGGGLRNLELYDDSTTHTRVGAPIKIVATASVPTGALRFENVRISSTDTLGAWERIINIDGSAHVNGCRQITFLNCGFFGARTAAESFRIVDAVAMSIVGGFLVPAPLSGATMGTRAGIKFINSGTGCNDIHVVGFECLGDLYTEGFNCSWAGGRIGSQVVGANAVEIAAVATNTLISAVVNGPVDNNSTNESCTVIDHNRITGVQTYHGFSTTSPTISVRVQGDTGDRLRIRGDGTIFGGDGAGAYDAYIQRLGVNQWRIQGTSYMDTIVASGEVWAAAGLRTNHVAAATPTGGVTGDIKIGNGKIWVNDAGTWKSVAIA